MFLSNFESWEVFSGRRQFFYTVSYGTESKHARQSVPVPMVQTGRDLSWSGTGAIIKPRSGRKRSCGIAYLRSVCFPRLKPHEEFLRCN